jgi:hypothetical protein
MSNFRFRGRLPKGVSFFEIAYWDHAPFLPQKFRDKFIDGAELSQMRHALFVERGGALVPQEGSGGLREAYLCATGFFLRSLYSSRDYYLIHPRFPGYVKALCGSFQASGRHHEFTKCHNWDRLISEFGCELSPNIKPGYSIWVPS